MRIPINCARKNVKTKREKETWILLIQTLGSPTLGFHLKRLLKTFDGVRLGLCILDLLQTNTITIILTIGFPKKSNP